MGFLAQFHPQIVHMPIALIIVALFFELVGRFVDLEWWRKAAFALLILGVLAARAAVLSGRGAGHEAERQGAPEQAVDRHEDIAMITLWLGIAAVVARAVAGRAGRARTAVAGLGLALHLAAAVTVGVAAHLGGELVFEHGVRVKALAQPAAAQPAADADEVHEEHGEN